MRHRGLGRALAGVALLASALACQANAGTPADQAPGPDVPNVAVGDPFTDFTAPDADGHPFTLSSLTGQPILLKFFRGHW